MADKELTDYHRDDHTKTIVIVVLCVLVCGGLVGAGFQVRESWRQYANPGNITATEPAPLMAEVATMEPTAIPSPTVDTVATQIALVNQIATQQTEINAYQEQIRQINIESQALEVRKVEAQAASDKALADKARADADKAAQDAIKADIALKMAQAEQEEIEIKTAMVSAVTQQKQAETGRVTNYAIIAIVAAFVMLGAIAMFRNRAQLTTDSRDQEVVTGAGAGDELPKSEPMVAHLHTDAGAIKRISNPPVTDSIFKKWAERVTTGDSAAIDVWETKESPFKGRLYRDYFYPWLDKNKMITRGTDGRTVLSAIGEDYCKEWMILHTPYSPIGLTTPNTAPTATVHTENGHGNAEGVGGGADDTKGQ